MYDVTLIIIGTFHVFTVAFVLIDTAIAYWAYNPYENVSTILAKMDDTRKEELYDVFQGDEPLSRLDWADGDILDKIMDDPMLKLSTLHHLETFLKKDFASVTTN